MLKMNKKATLSAAGVLTLGALVAILGTTAFFKDSKSATNTFTVGNVKIELYESQLHRVNAGVQNGQTPPQPTPLWTEGQTMEGTSSNTPDYTTGSNNWNLQYFSDAQIIADAEHYKDAGGYYDTNATNMVPGSSVRKNAYVKNTGSTDAYVRTRYLIPVSLFYIIDEGPSFWTTTAVGQGDGPVMYSDAVTYYNTHNYSMDGYPTVTRAHDNGDNTTTDIEYYSFDFIYKNTLAPEAMTFWNPWGNIAIDKNATSEDLANVESFDVIVEADAIQADGFSDATTAFANFGN